MRDYPKGVCRVYDNGGDTWDRYTVYFSSKMAGRGPQGEHAYVGMSRDPFTGFGQHGIGMLGRHNGKVVDFSGLPEDCQELVLADLMVGDDRHFVVDPADVKELSDEEYCQGCGQIGCGHGGQ